MKALIYLVSSLFVSFCVASSLPFNPAATYGTLYGLAADIVQLVKVNPATGSSTPVGAVLPSEIETQQLSSIDDKNKIYYLLGFDQSNSVVSLLGLDLNTGALKTKIALPFETSVFVGVGETVDVDPTNGDVFVSGRDPAVQHQHHILRVTPSTGQIKSVAVFGGIDVLGGNSCYDPKNQILWIDYGTNSSINFYGFNVTTGKLVMNVNDDAFNMETMDFDPVKGLIYGIGLKPINDTYGIRTLITLDSATGTFNVIGLIPDYFIINAEMSALDYTNRKLYVYLQKRGADDLPFNFVTIDLATAKVLAEPVGCTDPGECLWSLGFFNKPY